MKGLLKLTIAIFSLYIFVVVVVPYINRLSFFAPIQEVIKKYNINSSAFFYTDDISDNPEIKKYTDK